MRLTAFILLILSVLSGCKGDRCKSVTCLSGGTCVEGKCECTSAYEGDRCQTPIRNKFIRNWGVTNLTASQATPSYFSVSIEAGDAVDEVSIKNFHNLFSSVKGKIIKNTISIPVQSVQGKIVSGEGTIYSTSVYAVNSTISISYRVSDSKTQEVNDEVQEWK